MFTAVFRLTPFAIYTQMYPSFFFCVSLLFSCVRWIILQLSGKILCVSAIWNWLSLTYHRKKKREETTFTVKKITHIYYAKRCKIESKFNIANLCWNTFVFYESQYFIFTKRSEQFKEKPKKFCLSLKFVCTFSSFYSSTAFDF